MIRKGRPIFHLEYTRRKRLNNLAFSVYRHHMICQRVTDICSKTTLLGTFTVLRGAFILRLVQKCKWWLIGAIGTYNWSHKSLEPSFMTKILPWSARLQNLGCRYSSTNMQSLFLDRPLSIRVPQRWQLLRTVILGIALATLARQLICIIQGTFWVKMSHLKDLETK